MSTTHDTCAQGSETPRTQADHDPTVVPTCDVDADARTDHQIGIGTTSGVTDDESTDVTITFDSDELPCRQHDADLWFADKPADLETAKSHCRECPLRAECLDGALERSEPWGVWGGEIFDRGVVIARKRPRGRPRKHDVTTPVAA